MPVSSTQHPLVRDGKSQSERLDLGTLAPDSLALDGRNGQQLLAYLYEYAKSVAYYDEDMNAGNWQDFFRAGVSVQTAIISQYRPEQWKTQFETFQRNFGDGLNRSNLSPVLDFLFDTVIQVQNWYDGLANDTALVDDKLVFNENELRRTIGNLIASNLRQSLARLIAVANVWADKPVSNLPRNYDLPNLTSLDPILWELGVATRSARDAALRKLLGRPSDFEKAAGVKLNEIFQTFFNAIRDITGAASTIEAMPATQTHDPHLGLLYAFLRLFDKVRSTLNGMTKTHLDFYYRDVLGLKPKPHKPDEAHVVFELNKPYTQQRLLADTRLKDGKDDKGADVFFNLTDEIIVSKAQIQSLRSIHNDIKLYAAPVANSADGMGAEFQDPTNAIWPTLGQPDENLPARVGLMVASQLLRLSEGERTIKLTFSFSSFIPQEMISRLERRMGREESLKIADLQKDKTLSDEEAEKLSAKLPNKEELTRNDILRLKEMFSLWKNEERFNQISSYKIVEKTLKFFKENKIDLTRIKSRVYVGTIEEVKTTLETETGVSPWPDTTLENFEKTGIFDVELTGKKGWFRPADPIAFGANTISFKLGAKEDPVLDADPALLLTDYGIAEPLLRLTLNPYILCNGNSLYNTLKSNNLIGNITGVTINVEVDKLHNVTVRTDEGVVDAGKPFMPFGAVPGIGSRFSVDHPAFYGQEFIECKLVFEWDKLPINGFGKHYQVYSKEIGETINEDYFTTTVRFGPPPPENMTVKSGQLLFKPLINKNQREFPIHDLNEPNANPFILNNPIDFELDKDFFHSIYPQILTTQANKPPISKTDLETFKTNVINALTQAGCDPAITDIKNKIKAQIAALSVPTPINELIALQNFVTTIDSGLAVCDPQLTSIKTSINTKIDSDLRDKVSVVPLPPYTPIIKSVTLNYKVEVLNKGITLYHLHPFEESNYEKISLNSPLLPQFNDEGSLLIGLSDVTPGGTLDMLLQFEESTADSYLPAADVKWHYLKNNVWAEMEKGKNILDDGTKGLIRSGVVKMFVPFDIDRQSTILPAQHFWLKASAQLRTKAVCRAIAAHTQAVKAVFYAESDNDLSRLSAPLSPASISKMAEADPLIKGVQQPYESFGGRAPEDDPAFYARASEQLRHKGRAVTLFDYEQLVLEAFPEIYKVKCITHTFAPRVSGQQKLDNEVAPGYVTVVVVPNVALLAIAERLEPKVSRSRLEEIDTFLRNRISPFVRLRVMNPAFEKVSTVFKVKFNAGKSPEFYRELLQKDIRQFLAPWAYASDAPIAFGGTLYKSSLVGFIENRPYVDFIEGFIMYKEEEAPSEEINTSKARSILISGKHDIGIL